MGVGIADLQGAQNLIHSLGPPSSSFVFFLGWVGGRKLRKKVRWVCRREGRRRWKFLQKTPFKSITCKAMGAFDLF